MTKYSFFIALATLSIWTTACKSSNNDSTDSGSPPVDDTGPASEVDVVYSASTFTVDLRPDEVYGQGQTHSGWNAPDPEEMDLKLDLYVPDNDGTERPLVVFTHGGAWTEGDKGSNGRLFCDFFAERGFVCASINYRLLEDYGTIPLDYANATLAIEDLTNGQREKFFAMYPAGRDCKAAVRWLVANASEIGVNPDAIALIGGSAGSFNSIAMDVSEPEDYRDEISLEEDPTLVSTNLDVEYEIQAVVNHWGGAGMIQFLGDVYGFDRFDSTDAPILIVHGTEDESVDFSNAEELVEIYTNVGVHNELVSLQEEGHGAWSATVDGKSLIELSFDFVTEQLELTVVD